MEQQCKMIGESTSLQATFHVSKMQAGIHRISSESYQKAIQRIKS